MRPVTQFIKDNFKGELIGCEIGDYKGDNALEMLKNLSISKLLLIDPYLAYSEYTDVNWSSKLQTDYDNYWNTAHEKLANYPVEFIREKSQSIKINVPIDFVYIDGNHSYAYAKYDTERYYGFLNKGGVLSGDNYTYDYPGVMKAVNELCSLGRLELHLKYWGQSRDWWVIKE